MPVLPNARQERLAQELAKGVSATEAMRVAGYCDPRNSTRLTKNNEVAKRVRELQARASEGVIITRQKVLEELASIAFAPLDDRNVKVSDKRAAAVDIARIEGWIIERRETGAPGEFAGMDAEQLRAAIAERLASCGGMKH